MTQNKPKSTKPLDHSDFESDLRSRRSHVEILALQRVAELELKVFEQISEAVATALSQFMAAQQLGIVELTKMLETSTRQTNSIMKCQANLTINSIAEICAVIGKEARLTFEPIGRSNKVARGK